MTDPTVATLLRHVAALGYRVSVHHLDASLYGTIPACVELHAVMVETGEQHVVKVVIGEGDEEYRAACELAASVGVELEG